MQLEPRLGLRLCWDIDFDQVGSVWMTVLKLCPTKYYKENLCSECPTIGAGRFRSRVLTAGQPPSSRCYIVALFLMFVVVVGGGGGGEGMHLYDCTDIFFSSQLCKCLWPVSCFWRSKMAEELDERNLEQLFTWIDSIPLTRPKKDLKRDFSDGGRLRKVSVNSPVKSWNYRKLYPLHVPECRHSSWTSLF